MYVERRRRATVARLQAALAAVALAVGAAVYLLDRGGDVGFVPAALAERLSVHRVFGLLGGSLPSFTHAFAFALLTAAVLRPWPALARLGCAVWVLIDAVFELAQIHAVGGVLGAAIGRSANGPAAAVLAPLGAYLASGTFDVLDLAAIAAGGAAAYLVVAASEPGG